MIKIPYTNKQWQYSTESDVMGNVVNCHNMTFDKKGYATLNAKMGEVFGSDTLVETVKSFVLRGTVVDAITTDEIYSATLAIGSDAPFFADAGTTQGGTSSSGVFWNGMTVYTDATRLITWDGSSDTNRNTGLTSSNFHPLCIFDSANKIAVGDVNIVKLFDTSWTLDTANQLTIPANYVITWIRYVGNNLYIGTQSLSMANGRMFVWNGTGTAAQASYDEGGVWSFSGQVYGSTIVQINSRGQLMEFTGAGFKMLAALPVYYTQQLWRGSGGFSIGKVMSDGIQVDGDNIFICLDGNVERTDYEYGKNSLTYIPEQPSGVWCYDPNIGLYPFSLLSNDVVQDIAISSIDTTTNILTVSAHSFKTGDKVRYNASVAAGGLNTTQNYYIININSTTFKLAYTYDLAIAGTAIDITSGGTSSRVLGYLHADFGIPSIDRAGAVGLYKELQAPTHSIYSQYLLTNGYTKKSNLSTQRKSICSLQKNENRGSLTTPKINSSAITDRYQTLVIKYSGIYDGNDKIILKSRTSTRAGIPFCTLNQASTDATWTSTTTFTVVSPEFSLVSVGDEVFVIQGAGSGYTAHITEISESTGTYTVTIDEAVTGVTNGDKFHFVANNWSKKLVISSSSVDNDKGYATFNIDSASKWFQFKLELRGEGVQIEELQLIQIPDKSK